MREYRTQNPLPIAKDKVKEVLDIMDVAEAFSGQINTRPTQRQASRLLPDLHRHQHILL